VRCAEAAYDVLVSVDEDEPLARVAGMLASLCVFGGEATKQGLVEAIESAIALDRRERADELLRLVECFEELRAVSWLERASQLRDSSAAEAVA
jgi:hypothetical protein